MTPTTEIRPAMAADYPAVIALLEAAGLPIAGIPRWFAPATGAVASVLRSSARFSTAPATAKCGRSTS